MNRIFALIMSSLLLILSGPTAFSQKFVWGVKAGSTWSMNSFIDQDDKDEFSSKSKAGFFGSGLINLPLKKNYSIQTEIGFSQRGRKVYFNHDTSAHIAIYNYLDASIIARKSFPVQWGEHIPGNWFINAGPRISHWLNGRGRVSGGEPFDYDVVFGPLSEVPLIKPDEMYLKETNRWLVGFDIGLGIDAPIRKNQDVVIELRYSYGFIQYGNKNSAYTSQPGFRDSLKATEQIISLSIGYTIEHDIKEPRKGKSTKEKRKKSKPRKEIDSLLH